MAFLYGIIRLDMYLQRVVDLVKYENRVKAGLTEKSLAEIYAYASTETGRGPCTSVHELLLPARSTFEKGMLLTLCDNLKEAVEAVTVVFGALEGYYCAVNEKIVPKIDPQLYYSVNIGKELKFVRELYEDVFSSNALRVEFHSQRNSCEEAFKIVEMTEKKETKHLLSKSVFAVEKMDHFDPEAFKVDRNLVHQIISQTFLIVRHVDLLDVGPIDIEVARRYIDAKVDLKQFIDLRMKKRNNEFLKKVVYSLSMSDLNDMVGYSLEHDVIMSNERSDRFKPKTQTGDGAGDGEQSSAEGNFEMKVRKFCFDIVSEEFGGSFVVIKLLKAMLCSTKTDFQKAHIMVFRKVPSLSDFFNGYRLCNTSPLRFIDVFCCHFGNGREAFEKCNDIFSLLCSRGENGHRVLDPEAVINGFIFPSFEQSHKLEAFCYKLLMLLLDPEKMDITWSFGHSYPNGVVGGENCEARNGTSVIIGKHEDRSVSAVRMIRMLFNCYEYSNSRWGKSESANLRRVEKLLSLVDEQLHENGSVLTKEAKDSLFGVCEALQIPCAGVYYLCKVLMPNTFDFLRFEKMDEPVRKNCREYAEWVCRWVQTAFAGSPDKSLSAFGNALQEVDISKDDLEIAFGKCFDQLAPTFWSTKTLMRLKRIFETHGNNCQSFEGDCTVFMVADWLFSVTVKMRESGISEDELETTKKAMLSWLTAELRKCHLALDVNQNTVTCFESWRSESESLEKMIDDMVSAFKHIYKSNGA